MNPSEGLGKKQFHSVLSRKGGQTARAIWNLPILPDYPSYYLFALAVAERTKDSPLVNTKNT